MIIMYLFFHVLCENLALAESSAGVKALAGAGCASVQQNSGDPGDRGVQNPLYMQK